MIVHVTKAAYLRDYKVYLEFNDGKKGVVDLEDKAKRDGVFKPLHDLDYFRQLRLDEKLDTICWPNGADLAPEMLYQRCLGAQDEMSLRPN